MERNPADVMENRPTDLPEYDEPPIDEIAVGLQFQPVQSTVGELTAAYREAVRGSFPRVEYQAKLPPSLPVFGGAVIGPFTSGPIVATPFPKPDPFGRVWLLADDGQYLVQLQDDRFIFNWRRSQDPYPRIKGILQRFWDNFDILRTVAAPFAAGILVHQIEISYYNWIPEAEMSQFEAMRTAHSSGVTSRHLSIDPELQNWMGNYTVAKDGALIARLTVQSGGSIVRINRTTQQMERGSVINFQVNAPIAPGSTDSDIQSIFEHARLVIVDAFDQLTTEEAHEKWRRRS
jgi:uncharacterized protein (TIGR04255 family)